MKRRASVILLFILVFALSSVSLGKYSGGFGTAEQPYLISTPNDLNSIGLDPNDWDKHFLMTADINLADYIGTQFNIIGYYEKYGSPNNVPFDGVFDGNNHTIWNFNWDSDYIDVIGLFRALSESGRIMNLSLENVVVETGTGRRTGALVGVNEYGVISNCYSTGTVSGFVGASGLVGRNFYGTVSKCHWEGDVSGYDSVGGVVGSDQGGVITMCSSTGTISGVRGWLGGIVGESSGFISDCYSIAIVSGERYVGGIVGYYYPHIFLSENSVISNCYSAGSVTGNRFCAGGLVGVNVGMVTNCYSVANVSGDRKIGGLVGENMGSISNCYSTGGISGEFRLIGGLVGYNTGTISNCYATGAVDGNDYTGGLVGSSIDVNDVNASFWDIETTGQTTSSGGECKTTAEMQKQSTFADAGWDFVSETANGYEDIWRMCQDGVDYPHLAWEFYNYGDLTCPDGVDFIDYSVLANQWMLEKLEQDYNSDGRVNFKDYAEFANNWGVSYTELSSFLAHWLARSASQADIAPLGGDDFVDWQDLMLLCENWLSQ